MADAVIEILTEATPEAVEQINHLLPQLSLKAKNLDLARLKQIVQMSGSTYVARVDGAIVGMAQRVDVYQPRRIKSWIEDYVVDEAFRGQGIATRLLRMAIDEAPPAAESVNLTSKLVREDAHKLYAKLGFVQRDETTVWRLILPGR
jgi:GNAT superfamily N-acetyltransferase